MGKSGTTELISNYSLATIIICSGLAGVWITEDGGVTFKSACMVFVVVATVFSIKRYKKG